MHAGFAQGMLRGMRRLALVVTLALLVVAAPARAATPLPVGESHGVRAYRVHGAIVVRFTERAAQLYRRIAGKRVTITCTELPEDRNTVGIVGVGAAARRSVPRSGAARSAPATRPAAPTTAACGSRGARCRRNGERRRLPRQLIASVSLTQDGAVYLDEQEKALALFGLLLYAGEQGDGSAYPSTAALLQAIHDADGSRRIVALASPADTPAPGRIGYYSDGALHVAVVIVSGSGRRLFIEYENDVLHTNVGYPSGSFELGGYRSCSTDRMFPAGSLNQAMYGPSPRAIPRSSCSKPS